jgi:acyl transferase domain-containing protein
VVLKSREEAQRDGDNILAVLNGSAINQDGRSSGLTVPNGPSQQKVIRDALMDGSLTPADVGYIEAHGTGTPLGDQIEANSIVNVLSEGRSRRQGIVLSAVKSNIGHLEGAAGIAGLIKTILAVQTAHSGHVWFLEAQQLDRFQGFERHGQLRCHQLAQRPFQKVAGVSSFGFGGTNAHVVVSEAPPSESPFVEAFAPNEGNVLVVTATPGKALEQLAQRYADFIEANPEVSVGRLCYAVNTGRAALAQRAVFYGHDNQPDVLVKNVRAYASAPEYSAMAVGKASDVSSNVAMIFPS